MIVRLMVPKQVTVLFQEEEGRKKKELSRIIQLAETAVRFGAR